MHYNWLTTDNTESLFFSAVLVSRKREANSPEIIPSIFCFYIRGRDLALLQNLEKKLGALLSRGLFVRGLFWRTNPSKG